MEEKKINAFISNLGKYNEGQLVGEWVSFPVTREEMQAVFDRIGINDQYEEYFITDYDINIPTMRANLLGEYESLDRLNYLAGRLNELDSEELEKFEEILSSGIDLYQEPGLEAYINLTYNLDTYDLYPDVNNEYDLGYYIVHEIGSYDLEAMGDLTMYIDYEALGRDTMINDMCSFSEHGYVVYDNTKWNIVYDGKMGSIPDEYRVNYGAEQVPAPNGSEIEQFAFVEATRPSNWRSNGTPVWAPAEEVNTNTETELAEEMSEEEVMLLEAQAEQGMILEP